MGDGESKKASRRGPKVRPRPVCIAIESGVRVGQRLRFAQDTITVGRLPANDVCLADDSTLSGAHAVLKWEGAPSPKGGAWILEDLNSKNGTFLEAAGVRRRVEGREPIQSGQVFLVGRTALAFDPFSMKDHLEQPAGVHPGTGEGEVQPALVIRVEVEGNKLRYDLPSTGAYGARYTIAFAPDEVGEVSRELYALVSTPRGDGLEHAVCAALDREILDGLKRIGRHLHDYLLPKHVKERLAHEARSSHAASDLFLIHDPALVNVPWELLVSDGNTVCLRFNFGRQVTVDDCSSRMEPSHEDRAPRMLIIANPTEDLPETQPHAEALYEAVGRQRPDVGVTFLSGGRAERFDVLAKLEESDIAYFVGHAFHDGQAPENSGWLLRKGKITCADFRNLRRAPSLVFANGCETAKEAAWSSKGGRECQAFGLASGFILSGVGSYLGALWPISAEVSLTFAKQFFAGLFQGRPVGECVRRARLKIVENYGYGELVWAAYTLYGSPTRKVL